MELKFVQNFCHRKCQVEGSQNSSEKKIFSKSAEFQVFYSYTQNRSFAS